MSRLGKICITILGLHLARPGISFSQNASVIWINASPRDTCFSNEVVQQFGNHVRGTYGVDDSLGEFECPPVPPPPFDALWRNIPGRTPFTWGGLRCGYDIRGWSSPSQTDTFLLDFYTICDLTSPFVFRWPDPSYLSARCDSMFIVEPTGRFPIINMFSIDSLRVPWNDSIVVARFLIIKYGARLVDVITDVGQGEQNRIAQFSLHPNYPNPFNPSTIIEFQIPNSGFVTLKVFDVLGRTVRTLLNEQKDAGRHRASFDATGLPSGVYVYRVQAGSYAASRKMILLR